MKSGVGYRVQSKVQGHAMRRRAGAPAHPMLNSRSGSGGGVSYNPLSTASGTGSFRGVSTKVRSTTSLHRQYRKSQI